MRLICPHCQQLVTVPDGSGPTPCPSCHQSITPPALTGAAIDAAPEPSPPPKPAPPPRTAVVSDGPAVPPFAPPPPSNPAGRPWLRMTLRRDVAHWLAPAALVVAFLLTFFTWVAVAPNGTRIYTQNAWEAAGGGFTSDPARDAVMNAEKELKPTTHWNPWLMAYVFLLIPSAAIAIADRVLARNPAMVPDILRSAWPYRQHIVAGLCALLFLLLVAPLVFGFGLEAAVAEVAAAPEPPSAGAAEPTTKEKADRDLRRDLTIARFGVRRTGWLCLAVLAHAVALAGAGSARWLDRHPGTPDPRIEVYC